MGKNEAHRLLDTARAGGRISRAAMTEALSATGDLGTFTRIERHAPAFDPANDYDGLPPVRIYRRAGTWERPAGLIQTRRADPFDGLTR